MRVWKWRRLAPWAVIGMLLLAFALRIHLLGAQEMGFDEIASVFIARQGPAGLLSYLRMAIREHPPLYYLLLSFWMPVAGRQEFAVRFLSVGIGLVTIAVMYRLTRKVAGCSVALLATLLLTLSPFHIHESQNARMYGLLALCSLLSFFTFARLLDQDRARWWGAFWLVTGLGAFTHYYMVFVLLAEDVFLLLNWRRYRHLWFRWLAIHLALGGIMGAWVVLSPGLGATILSFWERGFASSVRWNSLFRALNGLYLGATVNPNWPHLGTVLLLTAFGIGTAQWLKPGLLQRHRNGGLLLGLLIGIPLIVVLALPERVTGRYLTVALPTCVLAMGLALSWLAGIRPRLFVVGRVIYHSVWIVLLLWVAYVSVCAYPGVYAIPPNSFRARTAHVRAHRRPDDGFLIHGPWQWLLLTYYSPGPVKRYAIPLSGPRIDADVAGEELTRIFDAHDRVWVSYDAVTPVDPDWVVSRWLHEHTYTVWSEENLVLYYASPDQELMSDVGGDIRFGDRLQLERAAVTNLEPVGGEAVLVLTEWRVLQDIERDLALRLELVGPAGEVWGTYEYRVGPHRHAVEDLPAGEAFVERRGIVIPTGTPPGDYRLRLRVFSDGDEWLPEGGETFVTEPVVRVGHDTPPPYTLRALPGQDVRATFGDTLTLAGYEPGGLRFTQGNPVFFNVYWQALAPPSEEYALNIKMVADGGTVLVERSAQLVAEWTPTDSWAAGDVLLGRYAFSLPLDAPPGHYRLCLSVLAPDGTPLSVDGVRTFKILDLWPQEESLSGTEITLFDLQVETRPRRYSPPPMQHSLDVVLGGDMRLLGYDLVDSSVERGEAIELTLYWQAMRRMDRVYAIFNHVVGPDGTIVAQKDGWPQEGMYPTVQWLPGEVVEERYAILVPFETLPGEYQLRVGIYNAANNERPVTFVDGVSIPERHVVLTTIVVEE